jgi:hypothetical protein
MKTISGMTSNKDLQHWFKLSMVPLLLHSHNAKRPLHGGLFTKMKRFQAGQVQYSLQP